MDKKNSMGLTEDQFKKTFSRKEPEWVNTVKHLHWFTPTFSKGRHCKICYERKGWK